MSGEQSEPGFKVTIKDVYTDVQEVKTIIAQRLPEDVNARLRKAEQQIAALWVLFSIGCVVIGGVALKAFTG